MSLSCRHLCTATRGSTDGKWRCFLDCIGFFTLTSELLKRCRVRTPSVSPWPLWLTWCFLFVLPTYVCQIALFRHLNAADMSLADVVLEGNKWHILTPAGLRVDCFKTEYFFLKNKNQFENKTGTLLFTSGKSHPYIYFLLVLQLCLLPGTDKSQPFASKRFKI